MKMHKMFKTIHMCRKQTERKHVEAAEDSPALQLPPEPAGHFTFCAFFPLPQTSYRTPTHCHCFPWIYIFSLCNREPCRLHNRIAKCGICVRLGPAQPRAAPAIHHCAPAVRSAPLAQQGEDGGPVCQCDIHTPFAARAPNVQPKTASAFAA